MGGQLRTREHCPVSQRGRLPVPARQPRHGRDRGRIGVTSHRDAVGARLTLETSAGTQTRQVKGGGSYLSQSDLACFFGVPRAAKIGKVTIRWPSGLTQELTNLEPDRSIVVIER